MAKKLTLVTVVLMGWVCQPQQGHADLITLTGDMVHSTGHVGNFHGTLEYTAADAGHATLTIVLKNTTPAHGGYLTAFVLNNPGDAITGFALTGNGNGNFQLILADSSPNPASGVPYGAFDFGASTGSKFLGDGSPNGGLAINDQATFTFALTGANLHLLSTSSFVNELSTDPSQGHDAQFFLARFRGFAQDSPAGSDKVPADVVPTPEPSTLLLGALGLCLGVVPRAYRRFRAV